MKKTLGILLVFAILFLFGSMGCGGDTPQDPVSGQEPNLPQMENPDLGFPVTIVDSLGREITIEKIPERIISLSPAITEILFAIDAGEMIVGVTDYCHYPPEALEKPRVGGFSDPNLELIIEAEPEVVFVAGGIQADMVKLFEDLGISVVALDAQTLDEVLANIELAGLVTGTIDSSIALVEKLEGRIQRVEDKISSASGKPRVFFEVWDDPLMTAGPGSFIHSLITIAGGENVASDLSQDYAQFSLETLLERDPEVYVINDHAHTPTDVKNRPGYGELTAVQQDRVYAIEDDLVTLPGPRIVEGLEKMAEIIHPDLFSK
ncbi:MAG: cobalamin-binding protein [Clostridia bacterium]|nr:cobalamin-binding protein [Clostridia bacterium]